jgi:hypothetical protein
MESSRSGLLSTLLMTLPLIVVPAIALLRPPGAAPGVATSSLNADVSDSGEFLDDFDVQETKGRRSPADSDPDVSEEADEFDELFEEVAGAESDSGPGARKKSKASDDTGLLNPFDEPEASEDEAPLDLPDDSSESAEAIVEQLNASGALRTMWFDAGSRTPVGFAVFFRGQTELMRIRFEAVGQSREECARDVLMQVNRWREEQEQAQNQ